ncbi:MAG: sensor histidine kinase [Haliscomenobacter sp.]|uniref:sensor histidine kinase n=1 Tax=Haliscomenobacter sp. TaxID=2717303 RepID=UPI0029BD370E|nr:sensor histidine kinase [Haliscomenobacter sp.]MDX2067304.1 sensor histidine kinase [Haliscomenobacter sp.]
MNLFRKILSSLFCTLLFCAAWAQKQYPDLKDRYSPPQIDSLIKIYKANNDARGLGIAYELKGIFFQNIYFYSTATVNNFFISSQYYFKNDDFESYYRVKKRIADLFSIDDAMYTRAVDYYREALGYFQERGDVSEIAGYKLDLLNIAINKDSLREGPNGSIFPDVVQTLKTTIEQCKKLQDKSYLTYAYNLYASYLLQKRELDEAENYIDMSLKMSEPKTQLELLNFFHKGLIKKLKNNLPEAVVLLRKSELIAEIRNNKYLMQLICQNLAECYTALNNQAEAINYWKKTAAAFNRFYNSGETQLTRNEFTSNELRVITMEQQLAEQKQRYWNAILYSIFVALVLSGIIAYLIFKSRMREKDLINQRKISALELKSMKSLIEGQEKERNRVAKDLHDGLGANLSSIKLFIESQRDKYDATIQTQFLNPLAKNIDDACLETRSISHDLRPFSLKYGFNSALGDLVKKVQTALPQTEVIFHSYGEEPQIGEEIALMVYRIVQELLNNAAKYAKATQITLQIFYEPEQLSVHVEDDGQGFDLQKVKEGNGLGNIRSRVDYLGGQVIWQAAPQQGTAVILSIPLQNPFKNLG